MVEECDIDGRTAVNKRSALTLSEGNDAVIWAEQIICREKEEGRYEEDGTKLRQMQKRGGY